MNDRLARDSARLSMVVGVLASLWILFWVGQVIAERASEDLLYDRLGGAIVDSCVRVHRGQAIFAEPDEFFTAIVYTPLSYHVTAWVMGWAGESSAVCRLTCVAFVVLATLLMSLFVGTRTRSAWAAAAVWPLVAACYRGCRYFYDSPRVDQASALMIVAATVTAGWGASTGVGALIGVFLTLAFWCKQSTVAFAGAFLLGLLVMRPRQALVAGMTMALTLGASAWWMNVRTDGWFWTIAFGLTPEHEIPIDRVLSTFRDDWLGPLLLPFVSTLVLAGLWLGFRRKGESDRSPWIVGLSLVATLAFTTVSRGRVGATPKVLMPACILMAGLLPLLAHWWIHRFPGRRRTWQGVLSLALAAICLLNLFPRRDVLATAEDLQSWSAAHEEFARFAAKGPIWVAPWGFVTTSMEGQHMRPTLLALDDYLGTRGHPTGHPIPPTLERALTDQEFAAIFFPQYGQRVIRPLLEQHYRPKERILELKVGAARRPVKLGIFVPKKNAQ